MNSSPRHRRQRVFLAAGAALLMLVLGLRVSRSGETRPAESTHVMERRDFHLWSPFEGTIQAERRAPIFSRMSQPTAILFLAPEGSQVKAGDLVAELDRSALDQSLASLERDHALAKAELETLLQAEIPTERDTLANELNTLNYDLLKQQRVVESTVELHGGGLVSDSELESQRVLLANLETQVAFMESKARTLRDIVHPAREAKARAQLEAARRQYDLQIEQAEGSRLTAPIDGMVVYLPLHIDGEFRNVREGDTIFRNQKIMQIADMESLVAHCLVPESGISLVRPGNAALVTPAAFPDLRLGGVVENVGSVAMSVSGRPAWQKFFNVTLRLDDADPRLRSSMTVHVQILSSHEKNALVVPRGYVGWDRGQPWCLVREGGKALRRDLRLGLGNETHFLVAGGLVEGEIIVFPDHRP